MQTPVGATSSIAFFNLTPGNNVLISCSASIGGSNFQATSGNYIYVGSNNPSDSFTLDSFASASTYLGQWIFRGVVNSASTTYSCFNSQGLSGYVYMSVSEFSDTLTPIDEVSSSSVAQTTNATNLSTGAVGDLAYMVHFQDYFNPQGLTPAEATFVSSTRVEYSGQSRQEVYYDYRADTFSIDTSVSGWHYNDLGIANAVRYSVSGGGGPGSIIVTLPSLGGTYTEFSRWLTSVSGISPSSTYKVGILYSTEYFGEGSTSSAHVYQDFSGWFTPTSTSAHIPVTKNVFLTPAIALTPQEVQWYVQPVLYTSSTATYGTSTNFYIRVDWGSSSTQSFEYASSVLNYVTSSDQFSGDACDLGRATGTLNSIFCGVRAVILWGASVLFVPNASVVNANMSQLSSYRNITPFNLGFEVSDALRVAISSSSLAVSTGTIAYDLPRGGGSGPNVRFTLLYNGLLRDHVSPSFYWWWNELIVLLLAVAFAYGIFRLML